MWPSWGAANYIYCDRAKCSVDEYKDWYTAPVFPSDPDS